MDKQKLIKLKQDALKQYDDPFKPGWYTEKLRKEDVFIRLLDILIESKE